MQSARLTVHNSIKTNIISCCLILLLICLPILAGAASVVSSADPTDVHYPEASSAVIESVDPASQDQSKPRFKAAKDYYYRLERDQSIGQKRDKWLNGINDFQRIYRADPTSELAPSCLYMIARMHRRLYQKFNVYQDLDKAVSYFNDVVSFFPASDKAPDALYSIAQIQQVEKSDPDQAARYFRKVIVLYPQSSKKARAEKHLQEIVALHGSRQPVPDSPTVEPIAVIISQPEPAPEQPEPDQDAIKAVQKTEKKEEAAQRITMKLPVQKTSDPAAQEIEKKTEKPTQKEKEVIRETVEVISNPLPVAIPVKTKISKRKGREPIAGIPLITSLKDEYRARPVEKIDSISMITTAEIAPDVRKEESTIAAAKNINTVKTKDSTKSPGNKLVNVLPVQYWSSRNYSRVVIRASAPVTYKASLIGKGKDKSRRLYLDFSKSYIPEKYRKPIPIEDGLLKQVRTGQFNSSTVRVVLDIESISDYKIFSLKDPFRVVVDVRGAKKDKLATFAPKKITPLSSVQATIGKKDPPRKEVFVVLRDNKKVKPSKEEAAASIDTSDTTASSLPVATPRKPRITQESLSLAQQLGLGVRHIVIDPGHGGRDPGATGFGLKEKDIVLKVALLTQKILQIEYNYEVTLTREKDTYIPLEERTAIANTRGADLFLSIHVNAHPKKSVRGVETFYLNLATNKEAMRVAARENATSTHNISELQGILADLMQNAKINESSLLADFIQDSMITGLEANSYPVKDLGVKQAPFYVLIGAEMPAILAEISFISNPEEAKLLGEDKYLETIARQIANGVTVYTGQRRAVADLL